MDLDIVTIALNLMMSDYKDNGNIDDTAKQFPASMLLEALVRGKSSLASVKPAHKNLLLRVIGALEMALHIDETVVRCQIDGLDESIMKELI